MKWLLWRDYRLNLLVVIAGAIFLLLPYFMTTVAIFWPGQRERTGDAIAQAFGLAAVASLWMSQLTIAFMGGNAFAGERADRSAEFMAYLPISSERRLASKLMLAAAIAVAIFGINIIVAFASIEPYRHHPEKFLEVVGLVFGTGVAAFGVGWLISALQSSPTFAVCGGIATPIIILMGLWTAISVAENVAPETIKSLDYAQTVGNTYVIINLVLGVIGFIIGTRHFLKRVEP